MNAKRSVAVAPNSGIVVLGTVVAPVGIVPTKLSSSRPGTTFTVARTSVSTNPLCSIRPPPGTSAEALAKAVATSSTIRLPKRCVTLTGIVSSEIRLNASPLPKL